MNRVGIVTQARTTSTRLPAKVLMELGSKTVLEHHLDRLLMSGLEVYVATTTNRADDPIVQIAERRGIVWHRGSESDVLSRFDDCAGGNALDTVVRVTSDCPLIDGRLIADAVVEFQEANDAHLYLSNTLERTFPRGMDFEIFSAQALAMAAAHATLPTHREHVTPYLYADERDNITRRNIYWDTDCSRYRVTLDTAEDLDLLRLLVEQHHAERLSCGQIIDLLDAHPELVAINADVEQKRLD